MLRVRGDEDASAFGVGVWQSTPARAIRKRQRGRFCPYLFDFSRRTSEADYGICGIDPNVSRPGIPSLLIYTSTGRILSDFIHIFHRDLGREKCLIWRRNRWNLRDRVVQDSLIIVVAKTFFSPTIARHTPIQLQYMLLP